MVREYYTLKTRTNTKISGMRVNSKGLESIFTMMENKNRIMGKRKTWEVLEFDDK